MKRLGLALAVLTALSSAPVRAESLKETLSFSTWFDFNPAIERGEKTNYNVLPLFVSSPEQGQGFGVKYAQESIWKKNDVIRILSVQTLKGTSAYRLQYELPPGTIEGAGIELHAAYENYVRYYYGVGNSVPEEDKSEYTPELAELRIPVLFALSRDLSMGISFHFENFKIVTMDGEGALRRDLPGLYSSDGAKLFTPGILLRLDTRNSRSNPSRGIYVEAAAEYSRKLTGTENDFTRWTGEARWYTPIGIKDHILGFRIFADRRNGKIPFYAYPELGGVFFNRGLIEGRFRDNIAFCGNIEYRLKIYQRLHWAFFVDAGNVYPKFQSFNLHLTKVTGGTGMRYYVPPGDLLLARVDAGYSSEGLLIYLTFDHPF